MSRFKNYQPICEDSINYDKCKWLLNEVCCNGDCKEYVADYPYPRCMCESKEDCNYFEKEDGVI